MTEAPTRSLTFSIIIQFPFTFTFDLGPSKFVDYKPLSMSIFGYRHVQENGSSGTRNDVMFTELGEFL